jgi:uncharacterized protein YutE (UPF0331/DUF86 family)/predicted nucleotidyltransferase
MEATPKIEAKLRGYLSTHGESEGLAAAYLFGSVARGTARPDSDVDMGVLYVDEPPPGLAGLGGHLEAALESLLRLPVQLVVLNRAPVDLAKRVLRDGILLLDRDRSRRIRFEVRTRQEFWDLEPFLRRYRRGPPSDAAVTPTDRELVLKKLARIEACVLELRTLGNPSAIRSDLRQERFVEHTLQIAIQSILDVASHIVSEERLGEPRTNQELIDLLARHAWIPQSLELPLHQMIGFRNVLVHGYDEVDVSVVEDIARHRLDDLLAFADAVRKRIA